MKKIAWMSIFLAMGTAGAVAGDAAKAAVVGDAAAGKEKSAACAACHGADGNSTNPVWPSLAGQHESYIVKQLQDFKSGSRKNALMAPQATSLSDADMANLAVYFAGQTRKVGTVKDNELAKAGEKLYRGGNAASQVPACIGCHGPVGKGNPVAKFPAISAQHAAYTEAQLLAFREKERANDLNGMMRGSAQFMSKAEAQALAAYLEGLAER